MIPEFNNLSEKEVELLYNAPVLLSVLAAANEEGMNEAEKADAFALAHLKTFTAEIALLPYYTEVEKRFENNFKAAEEKYYPYDAKKHDQLLQEIDRVNIIIGKLDRSYASELHKSLTRYTEHVKRAGRNFLVNFLFPVPIPGISD